MFQLHFLALPMLLPFLPDLAAQMEYLNTMVPRADFSFLLRIPAFVDTASASLRIIPLHPHLLIHLFPQSGILYIPFSIQNKSLDGPLRLLSVSVSITHVYLPLVLNTIAQLVCLGVHRLTTRVNAITLVLVIL